MGSILFFSKERENETNDPFERAGVAGFGIGGMRSRTNSY
jgi:hypothetical protein